VVRHSGPFWRELVRVLIPTLEGAVIGGLLWKAVSIGGTDLGVGFPVGLCSLIGYGVGLKRYFRQATPKHSWGFWLAVGLLLLPLIGEAVVGFLCGLPNGAWICQPSGW